MAPPNAFTNELGKWIFHEYIGSIVFVECHFKNLDEMKDLWNKVAPIVEKKQMRKEEKEAFKKREEILDDGVFYSTGFVVKAQNNRILILTCAHVLGESFSHSKPITSVEVEEYFDVRIMCDHREGRYRAGLEQSRVSVPAAVVNISCEMDMMLLSVSRDAFQNYCSENHRPIPMATACPEPLEKVIMLSWPPLRHRTAVSGEISHPSRPIDSISIGNPRGFICHLSEVNIPSEEGSSGAPLINGAGEYLSILHAGYGNRFSFFVRFEDVRNTMLLWGVV